MAELAGDPRRGRPAAPGRALAFVLHEEAEQPLGAVDPPVAGDVVVVVGPEGGISPEELAVLDRRRAPRRTAWDRTVLRTSTAGTAAAGVLLSRTPRWR